MARSTPLWQTAGTYAARLDRQLLAAIWPGGGVVGGRVTVNPGTMDVSIAPGGAAVPLVAPNGGALCTWDAPEVVKLDQAPGAGTTRIDLVIVQVRDPDLDGGGNGDFIITKVSGAPATLEAGTRPGDEAPDTLAITPATPDNSLVLVAIGVPGAQASLDTATVTQKALRLGSDPAWITPTLGNGWTVYAGRPHGYRRINGLVYFHGAIANGADGTVAFNLPPTYRPNNDRTFCVRMDSAGGAVGSLIIRAASGDVQLTIPTAGWNNFVCLDGVIFEADQA